MPANVNFLAGASDSPIAKLTGFALATLSDFDDESILNCDDITPGYTAPEAFNGEFGYAADVFSLGATMYECCVGRGRILDHDMCEGMMEMLGMDPGLQLPKEYLTKANLAATLRWLAEQGWIPESEAIETCLPGVFDILRDCWLPQSQRSTAQLVCIRSNVTLGAHARLERARAPKTLRDF